MSISIIDKVVTAPAPRKGFGEMFSEGKEKLDHFQKDMASILPSFPGQKVAKYFDLAIGIDAHTTLVPPAPLFAVPHIGMVFDIMGAIMSVIAAVVPPPEEGDGSIAAVCTAIVRGMAPSVMVQGQWIANAGTGIQHLPGIFEHIPFPIVAPMASSETFMGSSTVLADGGPCTTQYHPALSCNLIGIPSIPRVNKAKAKVALMAPTSLVSIIIPSGAPVLVGGPPTIDLFQLAFKLALKGLGKLWKKVGNKLKDLIDNVKNPKLAEILKHTKCRLFGDPVDAATGRIFSTNIDFELPGPIPLAWSRTYYSNAEIDGPLGYNWHHNYNMGLYDMRNGYFTLRLADGRETVMPDVHFGDTYYNRQEQLFFTKDEHGYLLTDAQKLRYRFNGNKNREGFAMLSSISSSSDFTIQFKYSANGDLQQIIDSRKQVLFVKTNENGYITQIHTTANGKDIILIQYSYDDVGNLIKVKDTLGAEKHFVYKGHLMIQVTNQSGQNFYWEYQGSGDNAKCIHTWGDDGVLEYWAEYKDGLTITRNSLGHTASYYYDESSPIYKIIDENGGITLQLYNAHQELEIIVDPEGLSQKYFFNTHGKIIKHINQNGDATTYTYDERLNLIELCSPTGATLTWVYDAQSRLIERKMPSGEILNYTYEGTHLRSIINKAGNAYHLFYDKRHQLMQLTLPNETFLQWQYDEMGQVLVQKDAMGQYTHYTYDDAGNVKTIIQPDGNMHCFNYDAAANLIHAKDDKHEVAFTYGSLGILKTRTQNGRTVRFNYDTELQLKSITNEGGELYRFGLDGLGQVVSEWGFDGTQRQYKRDGIGRVKQVIRPNGRYTHYCYDGMGRVISETHHDGSETAYKYNKNGQLIAAFNQDGTIQLKRDTAGRVIQEQQGVYNVTKNYDDFGRCIFTGSSLGAAIEHTYDALGFLTQTKTNNWQAQWQRNQQGLELQRNLSGGIQVNTQRDILGRVTRRSIGAQNIEQSRTRYEWAHGNKLQRLINEIQGHTTHFDYDAWDNLVSGTYNDNNGTETIYKAPDAIGNLFKTPNRKDRKYSKGGQLQEDEKYHYHYDGDGNLIFKEFKKNEGSIISSKKELERRLNIQTKGSATGWQYIWAGNGSLQKVINPHGNEVHFHYDPLGRRIAKQYKGKVTRWLWDGNVPLHEWEYEGKFPPAVLINEQGKIAVENEPVENVITWVYEEGSFVPCAKIIGEESYSIVADYLGTPTHAFNKEGTKVWERELDIYGAVRSLRGDRDFIPQLYQGQYVDAETGLAYNRFRYYDVNSGTYLSKDPIGLAGRNPTLYGYVKDTNTWIDRLGLNCSKGTATIRHFMGSEETGHFSIEIKLNDGESIHTHQIGGGQLYTHPNGHQYPTITKIVEADDFSPGDKVFKEVKIDLPNAKGAMDKQIDLMSKKTLGFYDPETNSCITHVTDVLNAGGANYGEGRRGIFKLIKENGFNLKDNPTN